MYVCMYVCIYVYYRGRSGDGDPDIELNPYLGLAVESLAHKKEVTLQMLWDTA